MDRLRAFATIAGIACFLNVQAHEAAVPRYRVNELSAPDSLKATCLKGYAQQAWAGRTNDLGVVNGTFTCYSQVDPVTPPATIQSDTFVASPWFGAAALPREGDGYSYSYTINNRGELFGYERWDTPGFTGSKWTLAGGHEKIFYDPACENIQFSAAVDGNGRYVVGWGLRGDPSQPPPLDQLCIFSRWLIRDAAGIETTVPLNGSPSALNALDIAVGIADRSAVRYNVRSGELRVLHAADSSHSAEAADINDLGEVAGRITNNSTAEVFNQCDPSVAVRWERSGSERKLPHLPGAVSSRAFGVGYNGETVGESGAGMYCGAASDGSTERAVIWIGARAYDLNTLIPRTGITLTFAYSVNRRGQITASGYLNSEPMSVCPNYDAPVDGTPVLENVPCHNMHLFVLTPVGR
ncbi:MAG TPA: hypothetical protein VIT67_22905 [Povalibacter sp.]